MLGRLRIAISKNIIILRGAVLAPINQEYYDCNYDIICNKPGYPDHY
jgi:hypothetical protein